ncbi:hypothetical protein H5T58_02295 [Candidatus Parcubacteria bacterium]|nr:hypothetical protein [Candidatus Parcubacteria bacterium]
MDKILSVDIDGVLSRDWGLGKYLPFRIIANLLLFCPFFRYLYFKRKATVVKSFLERRKERGNKIIIVSAVSNAHMEMVKAWLEKEQIPFDELRLNPHFGFRAPQLKSNVPFSVHLDDDPKIANYLSNTPGCRVKKLGSLFVIKRRLN